MNRNTPFSRLVLRYFPAALFVGCALVAAVRAMVFPAAAGGIPGPALAPLLFAAALAVMGIALAVQVYREVPETTTEDASAAHPMALPSLIGVLIAYALIMPLLGFISTTVIFVYACLRIFGHAGGIRAWAFAFGTSYVLVFVFSKLMNVPLPSGWIG
jgi:putative tricarboxylic transport membrane protein